jgi:hypothetical protein
MSDLHITEQGVGNPHDLDFDIRAMLEDDLAQLIHTHPSWAGLLVTGDIAATGKQQQYEKAADWFGRLTSMLGCPTEDIWTVPGNHDIDRDVLATRPEVMEWHNRLRGCPLEQVDYHLRKWSEAGPEGQLAPLHNYGRFATRYRCDIEPKKPFWTDNLALNDGSVLRLHGLTSPLISDASDDTGTNKLVLGGFQAQISTGNGVTGLLMCHHPLDWIRDADSSRNYFENRTALQMYGHKHAHRLARVNNSVELAAGALHPERGASWEPRYNIVTVCAGVHDSGRILEVTVQPRVWIRNDAKFGPTITADGTSIHHYAIPLPPWEPQPSTVNPYPATVTVTNAREDSYGAGEAPIMNRNRRLSYRFAQLPRPVQINIATRLELVDDCEHRLRPSALVNEIMKRAVAKGTQGRLWDEVEARYPDKTAGPNPFPEASK